MNSTLTLIALTTLAIPSLAFGFGMSIVDQDAEATARGDAFVATADSPAAIYYNPAGISQLQGQNVLLGTYGIYLQDRYTPVGGASVSTKGEVQAAPQFFYSYSFKDYPISLGLGFYSPYGLGLKWPQTTPFRVFALQGAVDYITANPVISWRINKTLSVAAGVTLNYVSTELSEGITPTPFNSFNFNGKGYAVGYNFGLLWQPTPQNSFGLNYHSRTSVDMHGRSTLAIPGDTYFVQDAELNSFQFPEFITGGYSFRPTPAWNFEADVTWTNWHDLKTVMLDQQASSSVPLDFDWQSSFLYELGATRYFSNGIHVSAGYIYSQNSVPTGSNYNPLIPDSARDIFSTGIGWKNDRYSCDLAYQLSYGAPRTIVGAANEEGETIDGNYSFISHALTFSIGYHF